MQLTPPLFEHCAVDSVSVFFWTEPSAQPRIRLVQILARPDIDRNAYDLRIIFYVVGTPQPVVVETFLERLR